MATNSPSFRPRSFDPLEIEFRTALINRDSELAIRTLQWGLSPNTRLTIPELGGTGDEGGKLPLSWAVKRQMGPLIEDLLNRKVDVNADTKEALRLGKEEGALPVFEHLLRLGAYDQRDVELLAQRFVEHDDVPHLRALFRCFPPDQALKDVLLRHAVRVRLTGMVNFLADEGADVNSFHGYPLQIAYDGCDVQSVKALINRGAQLELVRNQCYEVHDPDKEGDTRKSAWYRFEHLMRQVLTPPEHLYFRDRCFHEALRALGVKDEVLSRAKLQGAYMPELRWAAQPIIQIAFSAAYAAALVTTSPTQAKTIFELLLTNDIDRVSRTKGLTWRKYASYLAEPVLQIEHFADVIREASRLIAYPILLKGASTDIPTHRVLEKSYELTLGLVAADKSTLDLISLTDRWHRPEARFPDSLVPFQPSRSWKPLFAPCQLSSGLMVLSLTTSEELRLEGKLLRHCVGAGYYAQACAEGTSHIISIRRGGHPIATIELGDTAEGKNARQSGTRLSDRLLPRLKQFHGRNNAAAPKVAQDAWEQFLVLVDEMKVPILKTTPKFIGILGTRGQSVGYPIDQAAGFIPRIVDFYQERLVVERNNGTRLRFFGPDSEAAIRAAVTKHLPSTL